MPSTKVSDSSTRMRAARLHGPSDLRVEEVPHPGPPGPGQVLLRVQATGICGSDLHTYLDARIGDTPVEKPLILGHEFAGVVEAVGPDSVDGRFEPLQPGTRVAVDPAQPCGHCEWCEQGHPNLCCRLQFCGCYPDGGSLAEWMHMPARCCFPIPPDMEAATAALLEPLGVGLHAVDLAKVRVGHSVALLGAGPIGLSILQLLRLSGAAPIYVLDKYPWRLALAESLGGIPVSADQTGGIEHIMSDTAGRGVDIAIEAAWADVSVSQAAELARLGGRVVLVGIPADDRLTLKHSTARRKGLTLVVSRRMKHVYPRAIRLVNEGRVDLQRMISHRFPLAQTAQAFALNAAYQDNVVKIIIEN